jgi:hypothetical protein
MYLGQQREDENYSVMGSEAVSSVRYQCFGEVYYL